MKKKFIFFILVNVSLLFITQIYIAKENLTPIMGTGKLNEKQMFTYLKENNNKSGINPLSDQYIIDFVRATIKEAQKEGVNHDIAFALMMHETGFLNFGGDVIPEQNNFGGLGTTGGGVQGAYFPTMEEGIRAVVQHLKCYSSTQPLNEKCIDPRWNETLRGKAIYVEYLGYEDNPYKKGWAKPGKGYGLRILNHIKRANEVDTKGVLLPEEKKKLILEMPIIIIIITFIIVLFIKKYYYKINFKKSNKYLPTYKSKMRIRKNRKKF